MHGALGDVSRLLWSMPLGHHSEELDEDDEVLVGSEEAELEEDGRARHLFSQRTTSMETPPGVSRSGRLYQRASHSVMEYSKPTRNIKSYWSTYTSSPRPLPHHTVPSLTNWIPTLSFQGSKALLTNSRSPRRDLPDSLPLLLTANNGIQGKRTNSNSGTKVTGRARSLDLSR